jgi:hypothetical protein
MKSKNNYVFLLTRRHSGASTAMQLSQAKHWALVIATIARYAFGQNT